MPNTASKAGKMTGFQFFDRFVSFLLPGCALVGLLLLWQVAVTLGDVPAYIMPSPAAIAQRVWADLLSGDVLPHLGTTFTEVVFGLAIAVVLGVVLGTMIGIFPLVERIFYPLIVVIQTVPKVAIAPLVIIWFGYGISSKVATAALISFFPILVNVIAGIKTVDARRITLMKMLCANPWQIYMKVRLPNMMSYLFAGLEVAVILALIGAIVGEFVGSSVGLGSLIIQRQSMIDVAGVFSVLFYLSALGFSLTVIVKLAKAKFIFWSN